MKKLLFATMLATMGSTIFGGNFENNSPLREGAPIGFKNPAQTCWLNGTLTMLFGGQSPLARALLSLDRNNIKDPFTKALYDLIKDMHNKDKKSLSYKNDQMIPGQFWQELKKKMSAISFDKTEEDIEAFNTLLNALKNAIPNFDDTFGAAALGKRIGKKLEGYALQPFGTTSISNDTLPVIINEVAQDGVAIQKTVSPNLLWVRSYVEPKTPIRFALGLDLEKQFKADKQVLYLISGMTIYKSYRSTLETGELSEEKIHYAGLIADKTRKMWYLVDDSVVTTISDKQFANFAKNGVLVMEHQGANEIYKTEWYPSILQYTLLKQPQFAQKKNLKEEKPFSLENKQEKEAELQKKQEVEDFLFAKQLEQEQEEEKQEKEDEELAKLLQEEEE